MKKGLMSISDVVINGWNNYTINKDGVVKNAITGRIKKPSLANGYYHTVFSYNGLIFRPLIHRLIAQAFIPNPLNLPYVNHKDGNKLNNSIDNLEWVTAKENDQHASINGLKAFGERHGMSKLSNCDVVNIKKRLNSGESASDISCDYGVSKRMVYYINKGDYRRVA